MIRNITQSAWVRQLSSPVQSQVFQKPMSRGVSIAKRLNWITRKMTGENLCHLQLIFSPKLCIFAEISSFTSTRLNASFFPTLPDFYWKMATCCSWKRSHRMLVTITARHRINLPKRQAKPFTLPKSPSWHVRVMMPFSLIPTSYYRACKTQRCKFYPERRSCFTVRVMRIK